MADTPYFKQKDIFVSGRDGYHTYRIPSIMVTSRRTVLAFCEGRKHSGDDSGDIDMVMKRSVDHGNTWSKMQIIWDDGENTCGNPCPVVDLETGAIWLCMTHNLGCDHQRQILEQTSRGTRTVWMSKSMDDGLTWTKPTEITDATKKPDWTWYGTGPGAGIQLKSGRLVVPCSHVRSEDQQAYAHIIYSDDHGQTWQRGGSTSSDKVAECEAVELASGTLLLNMRNYNPALGDDASEYRHRAIATSPDQGLSWSVVSHDPTLVEPLCQASLRRLTWPDDDNRSRILFSNPATKSERKAMTIRLTYDECRTWPIAKQVHSGPAAYSCLAVLPDLTIVCLYERGSKHPYEKIALARFNIEWLTNRRDSLKKRATISGHRPHNQAP